MPISIPALLYYVPTPLPSLSRDPVLFLIHPGRRLFLLRVSRRHHESLGRQSERCLTWTWTDQTPLVYLPLTASCFLLALIQAAVQQPRILLPSCLVPKPTITLVLYQALFIFGINIKSHLTCSPSLPLPPKPNLPPSVYTSNDSSNQYTVDQKKIILIDLLNLLSLFPTIWSNFWGLVNITRY